MGGGVFHAARGLFGEADGEIEIKEGRHDGVGVGGVAVVVGMGAVLHQNQMIAAIGADLAGEIGAEVDLGDAVMGGDGMVGTDGDGLLALQIPLVHIGGEGVEEDDGEVSLIAQKAPHDALHILAARGVSAVVDGEFHKDQVGFLLHDVSLRAEEPQGGGGATHACVDLLHRDGGEAAGDGGDGAGGIAVFAVGGACALGDGAAEEGDAEGGAFGTVGE